MRLWPAVVLVAGCGRIRFDARPDAAVDAPPDALALTLACNAPVVLRPVDVTTSSHLSAAVATDHAVVAWLDPAGNIQQQVIRFSAPDAIVVGRSATIDPAVPRDQITVASNASAFVVLGGAAASFNTVIRVYDDNSISQVGTTTNAPATITSAVSSASFSGGTTVFAMLGTSAGGSLIVGLDAAGAPISSLSNGAADTRQSIVEAGGELALIEQTTGNNCEIVPVDEMLTQTGTVTQFGTAGACTNPIGAYSPGRTDVALFRHDTGDGDINDTIATFSAGAYTVAPETLLAQKADEPRAVGVADGYWASFATQGNLAAAHVDFTLSVALPPSIALGTLSDPSAHAIFVRKGVAYVVWLDSGQMSFAELCD